MQENHEFSGIRKYLWPIYSHELLKVIPLLLMFWGIVFNYAVLRQLKDTQVLTFGGIGGPIILYLKMAVFASAIAFTVIYANLSNRYSKNTVFYGLITGFMLFFVVFCFFIFPNREQLMLNTFADFLMRHIGWRWAMGGIAAIRHWDLSLFYVLSELWGSVALSLLFWGFANSISSTYDSKRYYAVLAVGGNLATVFAGRTLRWFASSSVAQAIKLGVAQNSAIAWQPTLIKSTWLVCGHGVMILIGYWFLVNVYKAQAPDGGSKTKKVKIKPGIADSFRIVAESPFVRYLSVLVISYGLCINIVEVMWKDQITKYFGGGNLQTAFTSDILMYTGAMSVFFGLFVSHNVLRIFSWTTTALVTPLLLGGTGVLFMISVICNVYTPGVFQSFGVDALYCIVIFGGIQNVLSKSIKYSLFDPTKEMVYIYSGDETIRTVGKAVVDVTFARAGKFLGSPIQLFFIALFGTLADSSLGIGGCLSVITFLWCSSVVKLGKMIKATEKEQQLAKAAEVSSDK